MKIRIGTRDSKLAMIQTEIVANHIRRNYPEIEIEIIPMKTTGDRIQNVTLDKIGGKGLFVKELDEALQEGHVDITVHSFKDMPMEVSPNLPIIAISKREDPRDVLITRQNHVLDMERDVIGTSSKRRSIQVKALGCQNIKSIRGNVETRIKKLDAGEYDGIILAAAGVIRSGITERITKYFTVEEMIPAACQGNLAVQGRRGEDYSYLEGFHDEEGAMIARAERAFVRKLDGGCSTPTAAYAIIEDGLMTMTGFYEDKDLCTHRAMIQGNPNAGEILGSRLAEQIKNSEEVRFHE